MREKADIERAWEFIVGFDSPRMDVSLRDQWKDLIEFMPVEDWERAVDQCFERPMRARSFRPSVSEFRGFAAPAPPARAVGGVVPGSVDKTPIRHQRGCSWCEGGWVEPQPGLDWGIHTVRPCEHCCRDQYDYWQKGGFTPSHLKGNR